MTWLTAKRFRAFVLLAAGASLVLNLALLDARALHGASVRPRVRQRERRDARDAHRDHAAVPGARVLRGRGPRTGPVVRGALARPAVVARGAGGALAQVASGPRRVDTDALRDIAQLRGLLNGGGDPCAVRRAVAAGLSARDRADAPHARRLSRCSAPLVLATLGVLNDRLTHGHAAAVLERSRTSLRTAEALARNAEAVVGMGMTRRRGRALASRVTTSCWRAAESRRGLGRARRVRARSCARCCRWSTLGVGAWLVIDCKPRAGVMIAATILLGRALQPVEHPDRRLAGARRCARRVATPWRAPDGRFARRRAFALPGADRPASTSSA